MKSARARLAAGIAALVLTACAPHGARDVPPILLFDGTGASLNDVAALKAILKRGSGKGWVLLVGTHPEAPEAWRRGMAFTTPADAANALAERLVGAALSGTSLAHD